MAPCETFNSRVKICNDVAVSGRRRVAVCGASSSGLVMAKELIETGKCDVTLFERTDSCGGVYGTAYKGSMLTGSSTIVCFGCFSTEEEANPTYWPIPKYVDYLERFCDHFKLRQRIRFNTIIKNIELPDSLDVCGNELVSVAYGASGDSVSEPTVEMFHNMVVATGITNGGSEAACIPEWPGSKTKFQGEIIHSMHFHDAADFKGKRVLVVGIGESGSDITLLLCKAGALSVCAQARKGPGFLIPRVYGPGAADLDTSRAYHGIPAWVWPRFGWRKFKLKLEERYMTKDDDVEVLKYLSKINGSQNPKTRFGTKNEGFCVAVVRHGARYVQSEICHFEENSVHFADGSSFDCDTVVFCGGYKVKFPAVDGETFKVVPRDLYKRVVHPDIGLRLTFCGFFRPGFGSVPNAAEMQARYLALLITGQRKLPSKANMVRQAIEDREIDFAQLGHDAHRIVALADFQRYMIDWANLIGCNPNLTKLFFTDPRLWWHVLFGQINCMQFRLTGPGAMPECRERILKMPMMPVPICLVEGVVLGICKLISVFLRAKSFAPVGF